MEGKHYPLTNLEGRLAAGSCPPPDPSDFGVESTMLPIPTVFVVFQILFHEESEIAQNNGLSIFEGFCRLA